MKKIILSIEGMTCSACSNGLEKYLNKQNGVINASVNRRNMLNKQDLRVWVYSKNSRYKNKVKQKK